MKRCQMLLLLSVMLLFIFIGCVDASSPDDDTGNPDTNHDNTIHVGDK